MVITYRAAIAIVSLAIYLPSLFLAVYIAARHGFGRNSGWIYLIIFALVRLVGASCQLATLNAPSAGLFTAVAITTGIGLSPLLLVCVGLLSRANDSTPRPLPPLLFRAVTILTLVGLILGIVGGSSAASDPTHAVQSTTKAGTLLFVASWLSLVVILVFINHARVTETGERRLVFAVAVSLPLLLVRLVYALLSSFANDSDFNLLTGNVTIWLCMAVLEEFGVVIVCLAAGVGLAVRPKQVGGKVGMAVKMGDAEGGQESGYMREGRYVQAASVSDGEVSPNDRMAFQGRRERPRRARRGGPITQLVGLGVDYYQSRKG